MFFIIYRKWTVIENNVIKNGVYIWDGITIESNVFVDLVLHLQWLILKKKYINPIKTKIKRELVLVLILQFMNWIEKFSWQVQVH